MSSRYLLGTNGSLRYATETDPYTQETTGFTEFGYTNEDVDMPNPNPHTSMGTGGEDGPYTNSPDPVEYEWDMTTVPVDENTPLEVALGNRAVDSVDEDGDGTPDYEQYLFTVERPLETLTFRHVQQDADYMAHYVGSKADVTFSWSMGEPINIDYSFTAAEQTDPEPAPTDISSDIDSDLQPFRAHQQGVISMTDANGLDREIATVTGGDISVNNGLEANHHGQGRDAYSVSEETNAARFEDMSLDYKPTDADLVKRAAENDVPVNVEIPFVRNERSDGIIDDALILTIENSPIVDAEMPFTNEGSLESSIELQPLSFEVEIRRPA